MPRQTLVQTINHTARRLPNWLLYTVCVLPAAWYFYLGLTGGLGADPVKALEHRYGLWALQLFIASLAITPLRDLTGINLVKARRAIGLLVFAYVFFHLLVWLFLDVQIWSNIWTDILKRPYITIGMVAFIMLIPLAITSNNLSIRKIGPLRWRKIHRLAYPAVVLGGVHFLMQVKTLRPEPFIYLAIIAVLLLMRIKFRSRRVPA